MKKDPEKYTYNLNSFGIDHDATFYSSSGTQYQFTYGSSGGSSITRYQASTDGSTTSGFKYGTWYENAKNLRTYADSNNVPVFVKLGMDSCAPCQNFDNKIMNNKDFDKWVKKQNYLFCSVNAKSNSDFNTPSSNAYYVMNTWMGWSSTNKFTIPSLMCYWKKPNGNVVMDRWTYEIDSMTYAELEDRIEKNFR